MNKYLEDINTLDFSGAKGQYGHDLSGCTPVLVMSGQAPTTTYAEEPSFEGEFSQESISYSTPKRVTVRTYRLRK